MVHLSKLIPIAHVLFFLLVLLLKTIEKKWTAFGVNSGVCLGDCSLVHVEALVTSLPNVWEGGCTRIRFRDLSSKELV